CYECNSNDCTTKVQSTIPVVNVTIGGTTTHYRDVTQQINTGGVDRAGCPYYGYGNRSDESENWVQLPQPPPAEAPAATAAADPGTRLEISAYDDPQPGLALWMGEPYPNPTHGDLTLRFTIPVRGQAKLELFDVTGRLVRTAFDRVMDAGTYQDVGVME